MEPLGVFPQNREPKMGGVSLGFDLQPTNNVQPPKDTHTHTRCSVGPAWYTLSSYAKVMTGHFLCRGGIIVQTLRESMLQGSYWTGQFKRIPKDNS